jgi:hypothetical protein
MSVYFFNVLALGSEALASTVYLIVMTSCLCKHGSDNAIILKAVHLASLNFMQFVIICLPSRFGL